MEMSTMPHVDFDCSHLEDGDYSFSDSNCQAKYVSCVAGAAWERECPEGLSFDLDSRVCMLIDEIIACGGSPPTEAPMLIINFDCPTPSGSFALLSHMCSPTYYICEDNVAKIAVCADPMIWDDSSKECRLPKDIKECSFDCSGKADASYSEGCSQNYWWCWEGKATKLACPDNMVFDADRVMCDFHANVVECGGVLPTTAPFVAADVTTLMPVDFDCTSVEDGQHAFKNGDVCQPKFVSCVGGFAWEMSCPDGLLFDPDQLLCERIEAIVACGGTAEPMTTAYSYEPTTLAAKHLTTRKAIKDNYGGYETTTLAAEPMTTRKAIVKDNYGSYEKPIKAVTPKQLIHKTTLKHFKPEHKPVHKEMKTTRFVADVTLPAENYYTEATTLAEPITTQRRSFDNYQTNSIERLRPEHHRRRHHHHREEALLTTTPFSKVDNLGYELGSDAEVLSVYGSYQTPVAEPTTRLPIKPIKTFSAYETPVAEVTTRKAFASYEVPTTRREIKTTRRAELTTPSYGYETTTRLPIKIETPAYSYETTTLEPTTRRQFKTTRRVELTTPSYSYETTTRLPIKIETPAYSYETTTLEPTTRRQFKTTRRVELTTPSYGYETTLPMKIETTTRPIKIEKSYGSYETPAAEFDITTRLPLKKKTTIKAELTTPSYYQQTTELAEEPTTLLRSAYGAKKILIAPTTLKPIKKELNAY